MTGRVLLWGVLLAPCVALAQQPNGQYIEARITTRSEGNGASPLVRTRVTREWTSAACVRTEGMPFKGDSSAYQLNLTAPARYYTVVPRDRAVYSMDSSGAKAVRAEAERRIASPPTTAAKPLGDGGVLLGHRTRKFEVQMSPTIPSPNGGAGSRMTLTTTYWVADDTTDPLVLTNRTLRGKVAAGDPSPLPKGVVLRSETRGAVLPGVTQLTTREVVAWRRESVPASRCALPQGYRAVDMLAEMRSMQSATAELQRLSRSTSPADRARAKALSDSLMEVLKRTAPAPRPLREAPNAMRIDGGAARKP